MSFLKISNQKAIFTIIKTSTWHMVMEGTNTKRPQQGHLQPQQQSKKKNRRRGRTTSVDKDGVKNDDNDERKHRDRKSVV